MITGLQEYEKHLVDTLGMIVEEREFTTRYHLPAHLGTGWTEVYREGSLYQNWFTQATFKTNLALEYSHSDDDAYLAISYLETIPHHNADQSTQVTRINEQRSFQDVSEPLNPRVSFPNNDTVNGFCPAGVEIHAVNIYLHTDFFDAKFPQQSVAFDFLKIMQSIDESVFRQNLDSILAQMLHSPYENEALYLFRQAKILELTAHLMALCNEQRNPSRITLSSFDKEQLGRVPIILADHITDPPSIAELARETTLNEFKLKAGFKQVYGTTIYEYLRKIRMEKAVVLLSGDISLSEIAHLLGYKSTRGFSDSFNKYCGMTPSSWRKKRARI